MAYDLSAELEATCNALGTFDKITNTYCRDENTLEAVKDLIRYLRRDNESHNTRRQLGEYRVLQTDLIPLLKYYSEDIELFDVLIRLLGNLTSPVLLLYNDEIPTDMSVRNEFLQILGHLQMHKESFADDKVWSILCTRLTQLLSIDSDERDEDSGLIIERILLLIRNVLNVPPNVEAEKHTHNDISIHDKVVWSLHRSGMLDVFLYMFCSEAEEMYYLYLLEILTLVLRDQAPEDVAKADRSRTNAEKEQDEAVMLGARQREQMQQQDRRRHLVAARHSRFCGSFTIQNVTSLGENNQMIYYKPLKKLSTSDLDAFKAKVKVPKSRLPVKDTAEARRSAHGLRIFLKDFCVEFLNAAYNRIMQNVRGKLLRAKSVHDGTYYLWAMKFFMEFNRYSAFDIKLVSETMCIPVFHFVQQQMENHFELIQSDKKKFKLWAKRLHVALQAYREMLLTLSLMDKSTDATVRESTGVLKNNVFYVLEYREFVLTLLLTYNQLKMTRSYLVDLMETQHIFLRMLEAFSGKGSTVLVAQKPKRKNKKKKKAPEHRLESQQVSSLEDKWDEVASQLTVILEGGENIPKDVVPFDAASEVPIDEQKATAMCRIQGHLKNNELELAVGLLRAAREVWQENDSFGTSTMAPEEEFLAIREIFFADLQNLGALASGSGAREPTPGPSTADQDDEDEEDDEEGLPPEPVETDFKFADFIKRFASPKIVQICASLLRDYAQNSSNTNRQVLKLMHRIAWDCSMSAMFFQASLFRTFQQIYREKRVPKYKELVKFAAYIVRQFVSVAGKNPKVFMELLFWKNSREAYDVVEGYGSYKEKSHSVKMAWTEPEEDELRLLFMEHKDKEITEDVVDWIVRNLVNSTRTRRAVIKKLKELMLMDYKGPAKKSASSRPPKDWREEEVQQLTQLYEQFREATDPLDCIVERLDVKRPKKRVADKLLELGLVQDRKELRKKRAKKSHMSGKQGRESDNSESELGSSDDDSDGQVKTVKSLVNRAAPKKSSKKTQKATPAEVAKLLINTMQKGFSESLKWIQESVTEAADDLEQEIDVDSGEGVPLVAVAECDILAMDDHVFKQMLLSLGMKEPADEQETYWRIPSNIALQDLRKISDTISEALEGRLSVPEVTEPPATKAGVSNDESSEEEYVFNRLKPSKTINEPSSSKHADEPSSSYNFQEIIDENRCDEDDERELFKNKDTHSSSELSDNEDDYDQSTSKKRKNILDSDSDGTPNTMKNKKKRVLCDSDADDAPMQNNKENIPVSPEDKLKKTKKKIIIASDSEDDGEMSKSEEDALHNEASNGHSNLNNIIEPGLKRKMIIESDED